MEKATCVTTCPLSVEVSSDRQEVWVQLQYCTILRESIGVLESVDRTQLRFLLDVFVHLIDTLEITCCKLHGREPALTHCILQLIYSGFF